MGQEFGGLKAGIYADIGRNTCSQAYGNPKSNLLPQGTLNEREVGLYGHIDQDVRQYFHEWGFDYFKVDACGLRAYAEENPKLLARGYAVFTPLIDFNAISRTDIAAVKGLYQHVARALKRENPDGDYVLSICVWGAADVRAWGKDVGGTSRTSDDLTPKWTRMLANFDSAVTRPLYAHPHGWNDPDMLFIGEGDFDAHHVTEARSHFTLWAMLNAPLLIGQDLTKVTKEQIEIYGNSDLIALNQDAGGHQAVLAYDTDDVQILVKSLRDPATKAVAIFNRTSTPLKVRPERQSIEIQR